MCVATALPFSAVYADDNLKFYWPLDEGSGTSIGASSGYPGTLYGGPTWILDGGIALDGVNDYARTNSTVTESMGVSDQAYTLSASVRVTDANESGNIIHISNNAGGGGWCISMLHIENGYFRAIGWDGEAVTAVDTVPAELNEWYSIANTWSPETDTLDLYVNGTLVASSPMTTYQAANVPVYVFAGINAATCSNNKGWFKGDVKDVRIYSRAITEEEAVANANASLGVISADLSPLDNAADVAIDANLVMTFSTTTVAAGAGSIGIYRVSDDMLVEEFTLDGGRVTIDGDTVTIDPVADFEFGTEYYVYIAETAFVDALGNVYLGVADNSTWTFTTAELQEEPAPSEEDDNQEDEDSSRRSESTRRQYGCRDEKAINYRTFVTHMQSYCEYDTIPVEQAAISNVRDLMLGMTGDDVLQLQKLLNDSGYILAETGAGSPGNETIIFGDRTHAALIRYQSENGVEPAIGYFGPITRANMGMKMLSGLWW